MFFVFLVLASFSSVYAENLNKTKRYLGGHLQGHGETKPILVYVDNVPSQSGEATIYPTNKPFAFANIPVKASYGVEGPKVHAQQVLYEFQQTPTNAVSNVHVKQLFQPPGEGHGSQGETETGPQTFSAAETVVNPVQHSAFTNHGQNYAHVSFHPLYHIQPTHVQSHQYIPGKYLYVNGKIIYQPQQSQAFQQNQQKLPLVNYRGVPNVPQRLIPPSHAPPMNYNRFQPPQQHQIQKITHPMTSPPTPVETEEQDNEELEEDPEEPRENYREDVEEDQEEDHENHPAFGKYSFDESDEEDSEKYREEEGDDESNAEEDDEDSRRGSSRHVSKKRTKPSKYNKKDSYSYSEGYSTSHKYEHPGKKSKGKKKPVQKKQYKSYKYKGKPRIEGRYSENVPVTHKHKLFKEKWYLTKSTDDKRERSSEDV